MQRALRLLIRAGLGTFRRLLRPGPRRLAALSALALAMGGCTTLTEYISNGFKVGPNYRRPAAPVAADWIDASDVRVRKEEDDLSRWWTVFNDPVLDALVQNAYRQNLSLREAGFRVLEARADLGIRVGEFFPQLQDMVGSYSRQALSLNAPNRQFIPQRFFSQWAYGFTLGWELDFWGRFRRAIEASADSLDASVEDYDDVLVTLLGDVAANYVQLRTLQQQLEYVRVNVGLQRETLAIAQARFKGGQATELDVDQAQSNLSQTEALVPELEVRIRQTNNRLCVLLGTPPEELLAKLGPAPIPTAPTSVAVGIPADLLRRRPDVRRQERLAAAQAARIGVAEADFYPAIAINGTIGYQAEELAQLFESLSFTGTVGPSFQWKILNYGRILNNVRLQEARFQELVTTYQNTVLQAGEEVENGLVLFLKSQQRAKYLAESVDAAEKAVKVAIAQYKGGLVDFNRVALLQQNLVQQQDLLAQARGDIALGLIQVYRALGGGWQIRCGPTEGMPVASVAAPETPQAELLPAPKAAPEPPKQ
jgi:NodT family efflux transporter outer membrane factor (OMF) lipoprotein